VAAVASVVLLWAAKPATSEWTQSGLLLLLGGVLWAATRWRRSARSRPAAG
jgi:hypothetical protein